MASASLPEKRYAWDIVKQLVAVFDWPLLMCLLALTVLSCITMYSAASDFPGRFEAHVRNLFVAFSVMWLCAQLTPNILMRAAVPLFVVGVVLLLGVALFGETTKGAKRWLHLGFLRIQPSEIMKIAMPLMLAWYFQRREGSLKAIDFLAASALLAVPIFLIARQPDLGTAILVAAAGLYVIFFAGLSLKFMLGVVAAVGLIAPFAGPYVWNHMHDYQRQRILTLIDPTTDPLGKGFHTIQSTIAVGSGGVTGKGWMQGTQTHLEFIPERTTDFIFAVFSEEFGLMGNALLLVLYFLLISRGLAIAANGATLFLRLLGGAISLIFFTYAFVNMGMVSGILPVVGVPLPWMSYGGTALVTLGCGAGILMAIQRQKKLVPT